MEQTKYHVELTKKEKKYVEAEGVSIAPNPLFIDYMKLCNAENWMYGYKEFLSQLLGDEL